MNKITFPIRDINKRKNFSNATGSAKAFSTNQAVFQQYGKLNNDIVENRYPWPNTNYHKGPPHTFDKKNEENTRSKFSKSENLYAEAAFVLVHNTLEKLCD